MLCYSTSRTLRPTQHGLGLLLLRRENGDGDGGAGTAQYSTVRVIDDGRPTFVHILTVGRPLRVEWLFPSAREKMAKNGPRRGDTVTHK